jgi:hypothetical protein
MAKAMPLLNTSTGAESERLQVVIALSDWIRFFDALAFINRDGGHREIYCAFAGEYSVFSKTPNFARSQDRTSAKRD